MNDTEKERDQFSRVIWAVAEEFGGQVSDKGLEVKFATLKEYSINQIRQAGSWLLKNRKEKFPAIPTTKEFIDAIEQVDNGMDISTRAGFEADKVFKKLKEWGGEALPLFHDKTSVYLMTYRWTFQELGRMNPEDLKWFRKRFVQAYNEMSGSNITPLLPTDPTHKIPANNLKKLIKQ